MFMDPAAGDYRVKDGSPALQLEFKNFAMDQFGVTSPRLKRIARVPDFPTIERPQASVADAKKLRDWQGAKLRDLGEMEFSALQVSESDKGVILAECPANSAAYKLGLRAGDFVQSVDGRAVRNVEEFLKAAGRFTSGKSLKLSLRRARQDMNVEMRANGKEPEKP
jgi:S1-C subfamily serine protease